MSNNNTEGSVAIWLGTFKTEEELFQYMKIHYEYDDERSIDSQFEKDFGLEYYDRDLVEFSRNANEENTLKDLLEGASYLESFIESVEDDAPVEHNVIIRIYDYEYTGERAAAKWEGNSLPFFQNIEYTKSVDLSWMGL